jgi:hypothetical protein
MAEFQWWLLIVGIVAGAGLVAVVFMESSRRDADIADEERAAEATWIAAWLASEDQPVDRADIDAVLLAHRQYLRLPPPDRLERFPSPGTPLPSEPSPTVAVGSAPSEIERTDAHESRALPPRMPVDRPVADAIRTPAADPQRRPAERDVPSPAD